MEYKIGLGKDDIAQTMAAFATSKGGYILIGVNNADGCPLGFKVGSEDKIRQMLYNIAKNITGGRIIMDVDFRPHQEDNKIIIIRVSEGDQKPYGWKGASYKRVGSSDEKLDPDEITKIRLESQHITFDSLSARVQNRTSNISDVDDDRLKKYILDVGSGKRNKVITFTDAINTLKTFDLLNNERELKNAAFLCFGKKIQKVFPQSKINFLIYGGNTIDNSKLRFRNVLGGSIIEQITEAFELIKANTENKIAMEGLRRFEISQYPLNAIREAIINAAAHRDYCITESDITVRLFEDRLEIMNPGGLMRGVILEDLKKGGHPSVRRNPLICKILDDLGYMEESGQGIKNMINAMKKYGLGEPIINANKDFFKIEFFGQKVRGIKPTKTLMATSLNLENFLSTKEQEGLKYIQSMLGLSITITKYMGAMNIKTRVTAKGYLDKLEEFGILKSKLVGKERVYTKQI